MRLLFIRQSRMDAMLSAIRRGAGIAWVAVLAVSCFAAIGQIIYMNR